MSGKRFRFKGKLFSLGGPLIDLSMKVLPWADIAPKKAAFKLHLGLDHDGLIPAFAEVSGGLESEMDVADSFAFPPGAPASEHSLLPVPVRSSFQPFLDINRRLISKKPLRLFNAERPVQLKEFHPPWIDWWGYVQGATQSVADHGCCKHWPEGDP